MNTLQQVVVVDLHRSTEPMYFDTIKEAQEYVANDETFEKAFIYTLFAVGEPIHTVNWQFSTETATNLIENKKVEVSKPLRKSPWTTTEERALQDATAKGMGPKAIAKQLHRSPGAITQKKIALGLTKKKVKKT